METSISGVKVNSALSSKRLPSLNLKSVEPYDFRAGKHLKITQDNAFTEQLKNLGLEQTDLSKITGLVARKQKKPKFPAQFSTYDPISTLINFIRVFLQESIWKNRNPYINVCNKGLRIISCNLLIPDTSFSIILLPGTTEAQEFVDFPIITLNLNFYYYSFPSSIQSNHLLLPSLSLKSEKETLISLFIKIQLHNSLKIITNKFLLTFFLLVFGIQYYHHLPFYKR